MGSTATRSLRQSRTAVRPRPHATIDVLPLPTTCPHGAVHELTGDFCAAAMQLLLSLPPEMCALGEHTASGEVTRVAAACCAGTRLPNTHSAVEAEQRRRAVDALRSELVRQWNAVPPAADTMLCALERLDHAQASAVDRIGDSVLHSTPDLAVEVAHDMRSPLTSILFLADLLHSGESGDINDVQKRQLGIIYGAALSLVGLTSDMVEMARGNTHSMSKPAPFSVNDVLRSVEKMVRPIAEQRGLELEVVTLNTDRRLGFSIPLGRVLLNLATNALKFTHEGSITLSAQALGGDRVEFAVSDTGNGIPAAALDTLYQPFRRQHDRPGGYRFSGTGLGLSMCRRLVAAMGSDMQIETGRGAGTRFFFRLTLPVARML